VLDLPLSRQVILRKFALRADKLLVLDLLPPPGWLAGSAFTSERDLVRDDGSALPVKR